MRRRLVVVFAMVTSMVAVAFVLPLALFVRNVAHERAVDDAEADAAALFPVLAVSDDPDAIALAISRTRTGAAGRLSVQLPGGARVGAAFDDDERVNDAAQDARAWSGDVAGGVASVRPVVRADRSVAVVRVFVPDGELRDGVVASWLVLGGVGVTLVIGSVALADRLARSLTRPVTALATAAHRLGTGDLAARVDPDGPAELAEVGVAFNTLAERVDELVHAEREDVADLAHRLRTPLTALALQVDQVQDPQVREQLADSARLLGRSLDAVIVEARRRSRDALPATCDLAAVVRERAEFWAALAEEQARPATIDVRPRPVPVRMRADDLAATLDVVLENVFTHTADATPYSVTVGVADGWVSCVVADEGPGFDHVPTRGASASSTGLGLDIARRAITDAGGTFVTAASPVGGAEIRIRLPLVS